ncbi:MAG: DUF4280 domain-containing protein [Alphaproteobacteria bacterium]|nr:DUF4280 domain-containing protein [Alphaproteobacteria bacterium]
MAGPTVSMGALTMCSFGMAPSTLMVLPISMTLTDCLPGANIMAMAPMVNVLPFAMCTSPANPMVIAATAAALGVLTPMPCIPMTVAPWIPTAPNVMLGGVPVLTADSLTMCMWAGVVKTTFPGEVNVISI